MALTGRRARELRARNGWSLQYLANISGINKAYLSEFENGQRTLPPGDLERLHGLLEQEQPPAAGRATPKLVVDGSRHRLVFVDSRGRTAYEPESAHLEWVEDDGTTYRMYLGK